METEEKIRSLKVEDLGKVEIRELPRYGLNYDQLRDTDDGEFFD